MSHNPPESNSGMYTFNARKRKPHLLRCTFFAVVFFQFLFGAQVNKLRTRLVSFFVCAKREKKDELFGSSMEVVSVTVLIKCQTIVWGKVLRRSGCLEDVPSDVLSL